MKSKQLIFTFVILFFVLNGFSQQTKLTTSEAIELRTNIVKRSENTSSIESEFVQFKHLSFLSNDIKSSGKLYYKSPNFIKWEYKSPFVYSATFKGDKLFINDAGKKSDLDLSRNKAFKSLNNLVVKSVKGDLFDSAEFEISYFVDDNNYSVHFIPKDKTLKDFITEFVIGFDKDSFEVLSVKMLESSEDYTLLIFNNQQFNQPIADAVFSN